MDCIEHGVTKSQTWLRGFHFHTVKGFYLVNEAEVNVFLEFPCFLYDPADVSNLISGSFVFSKSHLYLWSSQFTFGWGLAWRILSITLLDSILKSRDITLSTKVRLVKATVFPVVMYRCESWTVKKAERRRIDAFEVWCWRGLLRVPWTARRSNQSILKEISPGCSLEGLVLKLKLQYLATWWEELTHFKRPLCWERLRAGAEGDDRGRDCWMARTQWTWV